MAETYLHISTASESELQETVENPHVTLLSIRSRDNAVAGCRWGGVIQMGIYLQFAQHQDGR